VKSKRWRNEIFNEKIGGVELEICVKSFAHKNVAFIETFPHKNVIFLKIFPHKNVVFSCLFAQKNVVLQRN
jgi:hypothetical protein